MGIPRIKYYDAPTKVDLVRSPLPWKVEPDRAALLVHDMQNYFLRPYESDVFVNKMVANIDAIRRICHALDIPTFYTAQSGGQSAGMRGLLLDFWGEGMPKGAAQAIVQGLEPVEGKDQVLEKHRYSAFVKSDLLERLAQQRRNQLIICGVYAHIGCQVTATDAFMADIKPFFVADALGDFSLERHEMALRYVAHCSGKVVTTSQVLNELV
ncbi:isochorismatase family protein [Pendulispora brunnea]|uniref:Isochorismatase family protein n=1 Tax=Pendulispora brunnea TaxID=2905690 RepID=A0ABZ2KD09_9BACT